REASSWLADAPDCDLVLVGHGPQRCELERLAAEKGISERVHFLGFRADVPAILARSSLLVLPSRWEGMPNVVLEAMAAGLPVIATNVEGVAELLGDDADGQMVPFGDMAAFAAAVTRVLSDRDLAERLGRRNRHRAAEYFQINDMVERYQTLWTELTQGQTK
ncbi:MAG TPA: hypothetical protein DD670_18700, partial [Planctomycetaceae bacterium]|nr:hypothetical protein [Planctomycetaceae bacterium]